MYVVKFALLFILVFTPSRSCVLTETLQKFSNFVTLVLGGGRGVKKETKGIKFFIRHRHFDVAPYDICKLCFGC